jgi:hypothetical protein
MCETKLGICVPKIKKYKSFRTIHNCNNYYVFRTNIFSSNIIDYINLLHVSKYKIHVQNKTKIQVPSLNFFLPLTTLPLYHVRYFHTMCQKLLMKRNFKSSLQNIIQILFCNCLNFALNITLHVL